LLREDNRSKVRMNKRSGITTLFLDIGGVILTNGWDGPIRKRAAATFGLDYEEINERHHLTFSTYESGKIDIQEYLDRVIFFAERSFSKAEFKDFMFKQSQPFPDMIELIRETKRVHNLKIVTVSNEARELNDYRVNTFELRGFIDVFVVSCFVHFRKPDADIYRVALDIAQVNPQNVLCIDDRGMFVDQAVQLGIQGLHHTDYASTRAKLAQLGLGV
jgi:putative hydrolase of the HAD superfamily